jgi:hypothetical protein
MHLNLIPSNHILSFLTTHVKALYIVKVKLPMSTLYCIHQLVITSFQRTVRWLDVPSLWHSLVDEDVKSYSDFCSVCRECIVEWKNPQGMSGNKMLTPLLSFMESLWPRALLGFT